MPRTIIMAGSINTNGQQCREDLTRPGTYVTYDGNGERRSTLRDSFIVTAVSAAGFAAYGNA